MGISIQHLPTYDFQLPFLTLTAWFHHLPPQGLCEDPGDVLLFILPDAVKSAYFSYSSFIGQLSTLPTAQLLWVRPESPQLLEEAPGTPWQQHPSPGAPGAPSLWHTTVLSMAGMGDHTLWHIPTTTGQSVLFRTRVYGPFLCPPALNTDVCQLCACDQLRRVFPQQVNRARQSAGVAVGNPPLPFCCVVFLG